MKILKDRKLENATVELEIEVESGAIKGRYDAAYAEIQREAAIDGFRKGKVPMDIIRKRYQARADELVRDNTIREAYVDALKEKNYTPITHPRIDFDSFSPDQNLKFKAMFEIYPIVSLKDYKGISVDERQAKITDDDIALEMEGIRERFAVVTPKDPALSVEKGDIARIEIKRADDLSPEDLEKREWGAVAVIAGKRAEEWEFDTHVTGIKAGEVKNVYFTYPKDYSVTDLAGKKVSYMIRLVEASTRVLPALDDAFAKEAGYDSLDAMKEKIRTGLTEYLKSRAKAEARYAALDKIVEKGSFEIPPTLLEREKESVFAKFRQKLGLNAFNGTMQDFANALGKEGDGFLKKLTDEAMKSIKTTLALTEIAQAENLAVTPEEFSAELDRMAASGNTTRAEVDKAVRERDLVGTIRSEMLFEKALEFIYTHAKVKQLSPVSVKDFLKS